QTGAASSQHVSTNADFAAIWRVSDRFRVSNTFRWDNFRIPGGWNYLTSSLFGATLLSHPNVFSLASCPPPFTAATCPQHNASSPADVTNDFRNDFLKQDSKQDTLEGEYDFTRRIAGRVGIRYEQRNLIDNVSDLQLLTYYPNLAIRGCTDVALVNGICITSTFDAVTDTEKMHGFAALAGISVHPTNTLRATFDLEQWYANTVFVRIAPRAEARYRFQTSYTPRPWAVLGGSVNIVENSNADPAVDYRGHNRNYGMTASIAPRERFSVDLAYNYSDFLQNGIICFNDKPATGVVLPVVTSAGSCAALDSENPLLTNSFYFNDTNFGMGAFLFKPMKRVTTRVGYSITSVDGKAPQFNILQPDGSLHYKYHQPLADLSVDLGHNVSWNTAWNYYQYKEDVPVGPTASRYFHANTATIALRYAF
ncbi:MAG TPA: hypothetical protein VFJ47_09760, partial [Terriglobales bacterium]|nr:hypothetical protein [Terriglobales bacterium]